MLEDLWVPCIVVVAAIALYTILLKEFLKRSVAQTAVEGSADNDSATEKGTVESDACTSASPRLNETAPSSGCDYEVFLSFRGPDTRAGFTDFLYTSFIDVGICAFKDDEELRIGEEFSFELLQAINQSKILIPIFSKDYASSAWCLKELVQMVECQKIKEQKIMPIFYDVAPSEVRHQTGSYGKAFLSHKKNKRYDKKTLCEWKTALKKVSFLNGWDLHSMPDRREGKFARKLTQEIFTELKKAYLVVSDYLVSVDNHVDAIMEKIGAQIRETRIIGIHGMGGIGKTTIAKIIYNRLSHDFKNCCFLPDIRETSKVKGIPYLQNQLISDVFKMKCINIRHIDEGTQTIKDKLSNKRVLLLLDDVEKYNHMRALVGKGDWLGEGSKLIITTGNKDVLDVLEVDWSYEVSTMDLDQSLKLFSKHAFRRDYPLDEYIVQSKKAIKIAGGLPLALEVMGSLLFCKNKEMWDAILEKLANVPHVDVQGKLKISYDALDEGEKEIFLDIACLFIGYDKDILIHFWDEPKLFPKVAMEVLQSLSLIKIKENNKVWMHDQIRDFGRMLVSEEKIEKQTRVWNPEEALNLLWRHEGNTEAKALRLNFDGEQQCHFAYKDFKRLSNLRFLEVNDSMENFCAEERLSWHESPSNVFPTNENSNLLPQLRWLSWHKIPPAFNITNFSMKDVVILDLSKSKITDDWTGWSHIMVMKNLKVLDMSSCDNLRRTPIFSSHPNLERLILHGCQSLITIDRSIFQLKRLVSLDVSNCYNLQELPDELGRGNLKYLSLRWCTSLERLPNSIGNLESLIELNISNTSINELPNSIGNLKKLKVVKVWTSKLNKIPNTLWSMGNLEEIVASRVHNICGKHFHVIIGNGIYGSQSLKTLILKSAHIYALPRLPESLIELRLSELHTDEIPDLSNLTNLKDMDLGFSWRHRDGISNGLGEHPMPRWIGNLSKLETLDLHSHHVTTSPTDLTLPPCLNSLRLRRSDLHRLRRLPSTLSSLYLEDCKSLCSMEDLSNLKKLSSLFMSGATIAEIQGLGCLENLQELHLSWLGQVEILPDLSNLNKLRMLQVRYCGKVVEIQGQLPRFLDIFFVEGCGSLQKLPDLSSLVAKQVFVLRNCKKLNVETILDVARLNPQHFRFVNFEQLRILPDLSNSTELRHLEVERCDNLVEIQGELPQSLEVLKINLCKSLWKLPNLSSLTRLRKVHIDHYYDLVDIQGGLPQSLEELVIFSCESLQKLPYLASLIRLRKVRVKDCDSLVEIPSELPQSLKKLEINSCKSLRKLPNWSSLMGLQMVVIKKCSNLVDIQGELPQSLEELVIISCESLQKLPYLSSSIGLRELCIKDCDNLVEIPGELPQSLEKMEIKSCKSLRKLLKWSSSMGLRTVFMNKCSNEILGQLPQSLEKLVIFSCESLQKLPSLSSLIELREICIEDCDDLVEIRGELPQSLKKLEINSCKSLRKLPNWSSLMVLRMVFIDKCSNLVDIQDELPQFLEELVISSCGSLQKLPHLSRSMRLRVVCIHNCHNLVEIPSKLPQSLEKLIITSCKSLQKLPYLSSLVRLRKVDIKDCDNLVEIPSKLPQSLEELTINSCISLQKLPYLSSLERLREVHIEDCDNLVEISNQLPQSLKVLDICKCKSLQELPNLSSLKGLQWVKIKHCRKLNAHAISSLCLEKSVKFVGEDDESEEDE